MNRNRPGFKPGSRVQRAVWARDGDECQYCGYPAECIDHIEPYSYRHNNALSNLVLACNRCNAIAWAHYFDNFEAKRDWILLRRRPEMLRQLQTWELNGVAEGSGGGSGELEAPEAQLPAGVEEVTQPAVRKVESSTVPAGWFSLPRWRTAHQVEQMGTHGHIRLWGTVCGRAYQREDPVVDDAPLRAPEDMRRCGQCDREVGADA